MAYLVRGDEAYLRCCVNFYDFLQKTQCYATGGYGPDERFMDANGANPVRLTEGKVDTFVVWSPNGTKIAFSRYGANSIEAIYTMDASGANQIQLPVSIP